MKRMMSGDYETMLFFDVFLSGVSLRCGYHGGGAATNAPGIHFLKDS
jgi:hypothetical protein